MTTEVTITTEERIAKLAIQILVLEAELDRLRKAFFECKQYWAEVNRA